MRKRIFAILLLICLGLGTLSGCTARRADDDKLVVVCTVFPIYEWAKNVVGTVENVDVVLLVDNGTDLHSYQPTTKDMIEMVSADLLLYIGSESGSWVEESLKNRAREDRTLLDLSKVEGVTLRTTSAESVIEGHDHTHGHEDGHDHDHGTTDEHLWLSLANAIACTESIADAICDLDRANSERYRTNADAYIDELLKLDEAYAAAVAETQEPTLLFADRFPFVYLAEDYGIRYVAAYAGCSTETDATPSTVIHLAEHVDEWGMHTVCVTESSDGALAQSVIRATEQKNQRVAILDSMQSVTQKQIDQGVTYLGIMKKNLSVLQDIFEESK